MSSSVTAPLEEPARADVLDALRGFALLGILVSHVPDFSGVSFLSDLGQTVRSPSEADASVAAVLTALIQGKFLSLFALMFGIGFAVQMESAARGGRAFRGRYARRLATLFAFGLLHASLWYGDILKEYAIIGATLLFTVGLSARRLAALAAAVVALKVAWPFLILSLISSFPDVGGSGAGSGFSRIAVSAIAGDWTELYLSNKDLVGIKGLQLIYEGRALSILSMFLVGAWIGKMRIHYEFMRHRATLRWVFGLSALVGIAGEALLHPYRPLLSAYPPTMAWAIAHAAASLVTPALTLAYASGFLLLWAWVGDGWLQALAPVGRLALTTYLLQTAICIAIFYEVGFGLWGTVGAAGNLLIALTIFAAQMLIAAAWLRRFNFGPIEWVWRCATYGRHFPLRRRPEDCGRSG